MLGLSCASVAAYGSPPDNAVLGRFCRDSRYFVTAPSTVGDVGAAVCGYNLISDEDGVSPLVLSAISSYLENICSYDAGKNECLGTVEGFLAALMDALHVPIRQSHLVNWMPKAINFQATQKVRQIHDVSKGVGKSSKVAIQGKSFMALGREPLRSALKPGQLLYSTCYCREMSNEYDQKNGAIPEDVANHWTVYVGKIDGLPQFFDGGVTSVFKGCGRCREFAGSKKKCSQLEACLQECREELRADPEKFQPGSWCDPKNPSTCLFDVATYQKNMDKFAAGTRACSEAKKASCLFGARDLRSLLPGKN
jgi:hypothetical protein